MDPNSLFSHLPWEIWIDIISYMDYTTLYVSKDWYQICHKYLMHDPVIRERAQVNFYSILYQACVNTWVNTLQILIPCSDLYSEFVDKDYTDLLICACEQLDDNMLMFLFRRIPKQEYINSPKVLSRICVKKRWDVLRRFISMDKFAQVFNLLCDMGQTEQVAWLIRNSKVDLNYEEGINSAALNGHYDTCKLLLTFISFKLDPIVLCNTIFSESLGLVKLLKPHVIEITIECFSAAIHLNNYPIFRLLAKQFDFDAQPAISQLLINYACASTCSKILRLLLRRYSGELFTKDCAAIRNAIKNENTRVINILLADPRTTLQANSVAQNLFRAPRNTLLSILSYTYMRQVITEEHLTCIIIEKKELLQIAAANYWDELVEILSDYLDEFCHQILKYRNLL